MVWRSGCLYYLASTINPMLYSLMASRHYRRHIYRQVFTTNCRHRRRHRRHSLRGTENRKKASSSSTTADVVADALLLSSLTNNQGTTGGLFLPFNQMTPANTSLNEIGKEKQENDHNISLYRDDRERSEEGSHPPVQQHNILSWYHYNSFLFFLFIIF